MFSYTKMIYNVVFCLKTKGQAKIPDYISSSLMSPSICAFSDFDSKANHLGDGSRTPVKTRRHSWRQQIFLRVATPQKACDSPSRYEGTVRSGDEPVRLWHEEQQC